MDIIEEFKNELIAEFSILLTNKIKEFEKSGKFESSKNFNKFVINRTIKSELNLEIKKYIYEELKRIYNLRLQNNFNEYNEFIYVNSGTYNNNYIYISKPSKFFKLLIKKSNDKRFIKTLKYKKEDIEEIFGYEEKTYQHPLYFCISRCIRIHIKEVLSFV